MRDIIKAEIQSKSDMLLDVRKYLYENPELGFEEHLAFKRLTDEFRGLGFTVKENICGFDTAFEAVYDSGKEGATVAYFCEYDALPSLGHGCGHNLIAVISMGAAIGLKAVINEIGGKVVVFGTPAEETDGAKVMMANEGIFEGIAAAMMVHPCPVTEESGASMALIPMTIQYTGKAAHAAAAPEKGINALDAVILLFNSINALRQHVQKDVMFHGIITNGGVAANIIPDFAEAHFYVRAAKKNTLLDAVSRVEECARGAEKMTGAKLNIIYETGYDDLNTNKTLSAVFNENLLAFGEKKIMPPGAGLGSIDMGNVSYAAPSIHPWVGFGDASLVLHTKEFADRTMADDAADYIVRSAAALAATGCDVITSKELQRKITDEFNRSIK